MNSHKYIYWTKNLIFLRFIQSDQKYWQQLYTEPRGPWTATPALIKEKEIGQNNKHFFLKNIQSGAICVHSFTILA